MQRVIKSLTCGILAAAISISSGCGGKGGGQAGKTGKADNATPVSENVALAPALDNQPMGPPIATINGEPVTPMEFELFAREIFPMFEGKVSGEWAAAMDMLISTRLLAKKAISEGIDKNPRISSKIHLATDSIWMDPYWNSVVRGTVKLTEEDIKKAEPPFAELISVRQMVVSDKKQAEALHAQVVKDPSSFTKLVKEKSEGLTAKNGGIMSNVTRNSPQYDKKVIDLIFGLKKGEISPIVESQIGFMFFELVSRITPEEARKDWRKTQTESVLRKKEELVWNKKVAALAKKHKIKTYDANIKAFAKAKDSGKAPAELAGKPVFSVDNTTYYISDMIDPSGMGVLHDMKTMESMVNKKLDAYMVSREMDTLGLKPRYKSEQLLETYRKENILARGYLQSKSSKKTFKNADYVKYYNENSDKYLVPKGIEIYAIETLNADRVKQIYKALESGKRFEDVANEWSDNAKRYPNGRVGVIPWDNVAKEFSAVKSLKAGEYAKEPVVLTVREKDATKKLYVILKNNKVIEKHKIPFEAANKGDIEKALVAIDREKSILAVMNGLRKENKVEINESYKDFVKSKLAKNKPAGGKNVKHP